ncbi:MAG: hypothetical protein Kow0042_02170 [Calditrichia bacterium]
MSFILLLPEWGKGQIILTEIMFDPDTLEFHNEFVELYNMGDESVSLENWLVGDSLELDGIVDAGEGLQLLPGQFALVLDGSYLQNSTTYDSLIPPEALVVQIDDGAFGKSGFSNYEARPVILVSAGGDTMQWYRYTPDNTPGYSDEKVLLNADNQPVNWKNSTSFRGTPGYRNSVSPSDWDLAIDTLWNEPDFPVAEALFQMLAIVRNEGLQQVSDFEINVFNDENQNSQRDENELLVHQSYQVVLEFRDTLHLQWDITGLPAGDYRLGVEIVFPADQQLQNNIRFLIVHIENLGNPLVINEILYRPLPGYFEWVEIYNRSQNFINLQNWFFSDARDTVLITAKSVIIEPDAYLLLSGDSLVSQQYGIEPSRNVVVKSFPTLNNDRDDLKLLSVSGRLIERVPYTSSWMARETAPGVSLERINPYLSSEAAENWSASAAQSGSTPGRRNSLYVEKTVVKTKIHFSPNPFSPDGDGFEDYTLLQYNLSFDTGFLTVNIFDVLGRKIRQLANRQPIGPIGSIIWDGKDDDGRIARIGIYLVLAQIYEGENTLYDEVKSTVVLMKR